MADTNTREHLWDLIEDAGFGMLITQDGETLRSRPMDCKVDRERGVIHALTRRTDPKVEELHHDRDIAVAFANGDDGIYVSISGRGTVTSDPKLVEQCWDAGAEAWFKERDQVAVITLHPTQAEYWNNDKNIITSAFEFGKGYFTDATPDMGENAKVEL